MGCHACQKLDQDKATPRCMVLPRRTHHGSTLDVKTMNEPADVSTLEARDMHYCIAFHLSTRALSI